MKTKLENNKVCFINTLLQVLVNWFLLPLKESCMDNNIVSMEDNIGLLKACFLCIYGLPFFREEADELCRTLEENEDKSRVASEMADVLYHAMVLLALKDVKMEDVLQVLRQRFSQLGIDEKKNRV